MDTTCMFFLKNVKWEHNKLTDMKGNILYLYSYHKVWMAEQMRALPCKNKHIKALFDIAPNMQKK